jgi:hypothetical protein
MHNVVQQQKNSCNSLYKLSAGRSLKSCRTKELHGKPSSTRKSRTSNKHTKTQKKKKKKKKKLGGNKNKTRLLKHTEKNDRQAQERLNLDLRKPQHKKNKQTNKACNDKKKYKKTLSYIFTLKEGRCDCKQEKARVARFHS